MRVTFVLPEVYFGPIGGYKVVYEYANRLTARGHTVTIVFPMPAFQPWNTYMLFDSLLRRIRRAYLVPLLARLLRGRLRPRWFPLDSHVRVLYARGIETRFLPTADAIVATAWQTAGPVAACGPKCGRKFYLLQHDEGIFGTADSAVVEATFRLPLRKLVIARWLADVVRAAGGGDSDWLPNGLDMQEFPLTEKIKERDPRRLLMLYHQADWKGSADGLAALEHVRREKPDIKVTLFSAYPRPADLPEWIQFVQSPAHLAALYNQHAIFVWPSWAEGWGLPPAEAMLCGCAVASTDNGGIREFVTDEETGLLSPIKDPAALAENVLRLIGDNTLRQRLAAAGYTQVQQFTWEAATERLLSILNAAA